ncbi:major facilitator superfamily [Teratosphaeria destructans]|uniref:Major facilitator superfamily n=1 Tax=Teratosphaeria destructans TaxID=418781 RepID=A0A9W7SVC0_9PEZI|nr:major facilitator superfamily [Teratosphaeria destructans]
MDEESKVVLGAGGQAVPAASDESSRSPYSKREQWIIVSIVALAGLFSPLPANIFFPAIPQLAADFHRSTEDINLTVTIYLVFQGISPMLWGPLGDRVGRRPVFLLCLSVLVGSSLGLALTPTSAYWLLMFLRCFQSGGSASTIALGAGVISDIANIREKGTLFGAWAGMLAGSVATGRLLDWKYAQYKTHTVEEQRGFPIEQARLSTMPVHLIVFVASVVGWAWSIQLKTSIAVPLVLQVIRKIVLHNR